MTLDEYINLESKKLTDFYNWYKDAREYDGYIDEYGIENWPLEQQKHEWDTLFKVFKRKQ